MQSTFIRNLVVYVKFSRSIARQGKDYRGMARAKHVTPNVDEEESDFPSLRVEETKLASESRRRRNAYDGKSVHPTDVPDEEGKDWEVQRHGKRSTRLKRLKSHGKSLEDRVWCLFR